MDGAGDEDEGRKRHRWGEQGGQRDGEDGVVLHPAGNAGEHRFGDVLFEESEAAGLADGMGEEAAKCGADGGESDKEKDVGFGGGEGDEEDVGDAGNGEWDEGAVDCGDGEQANKTGVAHEVHEAAVGTSVGMRVRVDSRGCLKGEERRGWREVEKHVDDLTFVPMGKSREVLGAAS